MTSRKFSLRSLFMRIFKKRPDSAVVLTARKPKPTSARERVRSGIEPLEGRIAPAILLNAHTLTYNDIDGDAVTVTFSKDIFDMTSATLPTALAAVFKFTAGKAHTGAPNATDDVNQQLQLIDLGAVPSTAIGGVQVSRVAGVSFTVSAETNAGSGLPLGDGFTAIGAIKAGNNGLGTVVIDGDLGQIDAGTGTSRVGVGILVAQSIGKFGTSTQVASPTPDLTSEIKGRLGRLVVFEDVKGYIHVVDSTRVEPSGVKITQRGTIGLVTIFGSLVGDPLVAAASDNTGRIDSSFNIGTVVIGSDATDGIFGGGGKNSGAITALNAIGRVTVNGNIEGGAAEGSGSISSNGIIGYVTIGGDLKGGIGKSSGTVRSVGAMGYITVGSAADHHDIIGGSGEGSGAIVGSSTIRHVHVFGKVIGMGLRAGGIFAGGNLSSAIVDGNLTGGTGISSGVIDGARGVGPILIGGDIVGGDGVNSGAVVAGEALARIRVIGDVAGGNGFGSGAIVGGHDPATAVRTLGSVTIGGALTGGDGISSGTIRSGGSIAAVLVGTALQSGLAIEGGNGALSGTIFAESGISIVAALRGVAGGVGAGSASIHATGLLGRVVILGDLAGGAGAESGAIFSHENATAARPVAGDIGTVTITGNLLGAGERSALIEADGILGRATVGAIQGGTGAFSGAIVSGAGFVRSGPTAFIVVGGTIEGGSGNQSGTIEIGSRLGNLTAGGLNLASVRVADDLGVLRVNGDVIDSVITARGQAIHGATSDLAIGTIVITGSVTGSSIRAGYDIAGGAVNADAQIGNVRVVGNWTSSVLASGVIAGGDGVFGTLDDQLIPVTNSNRIIAQIARVVIDGNVDGTAGGSDHFGFVSQRIGAFSANGVAQPLTAAAGQSFEVGTTGDTTVREVVAVV